MARVRELPALPTVVVEVIRATGKADSSAREIASLVAKDPGFSARLLKAANSAWYGLPRSVGALSDAVLLLGMRSLRNLALIAATEDMLSREVAGYELGKGELWRHSLACAQAAEMLAEMLQMPEREEAFVAGLLHDVGKLILGLYLREERLSIYTVMMQGESTFLEAERKALGFDHAEIGGRIAMHWSLPLPLVQAIAYHHAPVQKGRVVPLAALVHIADLTCLMMGAGLGVGGLYVSVCGPALEALGVTEAQIEAVMSRLVSQLPDRMPGGTG
jgi:putative nucleotidyltransferase with HDIG domain